MMMMMMIMIVVKGGGHIVVYWIGEIITAIAAYMCNWLIIYLLTHFLTPLITVLLEKLTGFQLAKKFPTFYGTRKFITAFTSARHLSIS
jgi:hypothetical protein